MFLTLNDISVGIMLNNNLFLVKIILLKQPKILELHRFDLTFVYAFGRFSFLISDHFGVNTNSINFGKEVRLCLNFNNSPSGQKCPCCKPLKGEFIQNEIFTHYFLRF